MEFTVADATSQGSPHQSNPPEGPMANATAVSPETYLDIQLLLEWFSAFNPDERESFGCSAAMAIRGCDRELSSTRTRVETLMAQLSIAPRERGQCLESHPGCENKLDFKCKIEIFQVMFWSKWSIGDRKAFQAFFNNRYPMFCSFIYHLIDAK